ncbi:TetR/AcrR family transcriptional regulator [Mumia sp. Pv 4-285]|uniref:TetR/AcrR family transcriptional regulator n=1 Tax=Mumia qirimensis TaxID=3234852 RepID=UPI00351D89E9
MSGVRGRYVSGRQREESILEAAAARFAQAGYVNTSLAAIARDVGITQEGVLHYFPSKAHLLIAVHGRRMAEIQRWWGLLPAAPTAIDVFARMQLSTTLFANDPELVELSVLTAVETARLVKSKSSYEAADHPRVVAAVTAHFAGCLERGDLSPDVDPERLARQCIAMSDGLHFQWVICERAFDLASVCLDHLEYVARSVVPEDRLPADPRAAIAALAEEGLGDVAAADAAR